MKFQEVGLFFERNCRFKAALRRNSDLLMTILILSFRPLGKSHTGGPQKAKAFNFFSFPTRSNVSACYLKRGKKMAEHKFTEFLEERWKLWLLIRQASSVMLRK